MAADLTPKQAGKGGRPSKRTPAVEAAIIAAIRAGNYLETAARCGGIAPSTFYEWCEKYPEFGEAVEKARAEAEARNIQVIQDASLEHWQAAAWWLERSFPERYGRRERHEVGGVNGEAAIHFVLSPGEQHGRKELEE